MAERKIDPRSARLANIVVHPSTNLFDGDLPGERKEMVIAEGRGKFEGITMVLIEEISSDGTFKGLVYRPAEEYQAICRGREVFIDPENLRLGVIQIVKGKRGGWLPLEKIGVLTDAT